MRSTSGSTASPFKHIQFGCVLADMARYGHSPTCRSTACYAIVLPGRRSAFRAGLWPDCYRKSTDIDPPAGLRPPGGPISVFLL